VFRVCPLLHFLSWLLNSRMVIRWWHISWFPTSILMLRVVLVIALVIRMSFFIVIVIVCVFRITHFLVFYWWRKWTSTHWYSKLNNLFLERPNPFNYALSEDCLACNCCFLKLNL
jgi:hypothetical protein